MSQSGNLKEESSSGVGKAPSAASLRKCLARESSADEVEVRQVCGIEFGCIRIRQFSSEAQVPLVSVYNTLETLRTV